MKIVLNSDVEKVGRKGEVVEVAAGYARNYLLPRNLAIVATKGALKQAESLSRARQEKDKRDRSVFEALAQTIAGTKLRVEVRAGSQGQMFGSVTTSDIASELSKALDQEIDRRKVTLAEPIKKLGVHTFAVHLHPDVDAQGSIEVVSDGEIVEDPSDGDSEAEPALAEPSPTEASAAAEPTRESAETDPPAAEEAGPEGN